MRVVPLEPFGVRVAALSLPAVGPAEVASLCGLLAEHGVVVLPDQAVDDDTFVAFLRAFGALAFTVGETPVPGFPDLNVVSNVGRETPPRSSFHVDTSYLRSPPAYTALRAVQIPLEGGETLFTNQYRALETLPTGLREQIRDRTITHTVTGLDLGPEDERSAEHPIVRRHPLSGRSSLFLTTQARCTAVSGLSPEAAAITVQALFDHSTREHNIMRHTWSPHDLVMWDNSVVMHRADHDGVVGDRVMHRGMVAGQPARRA